MENLSFEEGERKKRRNSAERQNSFFGGARSDSNPDLWFVKTLYPAELLAQNYQKEQRLSDSLLIIVEHKKMSSINFNHSAASIDSSCVSGASPVKRSRE